MKNYKNIAIVIPSYNEVENIPILLKGIYKQLSGAKIIIVDDSSKEQNLKLKNFLKNKKNVSLISRLKKSGRGSAVLYGFKEALRNKNIEYVFEMDSDLAHDPKEMIRFLTLKDKQNPDLIIGSRYLPGGKIVNISSDRTIMSRVINKFLYYWLGMKLSDHTSGFRLYKRKAVEYLLSIEIKSKGFITLSEMAYKLFLAKFSIGEVPITWNYRIYGKSNVNTKELSNSLYCVIKMRLEESILNRFNFIKIFLILIVFLIALSIRGLTLNQIGRTWDEVEYIEQGYKMDNLLLKGDLSNNFFFTTYDHPPLVKYLYGITAHLDANHISKKGNPVFNYDFTSSRVLSAFFGSLSAALVALIVLEFSGLFVGFFAGIIFATLPFFVGLSQLVTTESFLMFIFTLCSYSFIKLIQNFSYKKVIAVGVITGIALQVKQSNALLFPLYFLFYVIYYFNNKLSIKFISKKYIYAAILIILISVLIFVAFWPMLFTKLDIISEINQRIWLVKTAPPEVFWGKLILAPIIYYPTMFFITTPLLILILFISGLKQIDQKKKWVYYCFLIWFLLPFIQSFYPWRQNGVRYIIEIYAPLSIIAALGVEWILNYFKKNNLRFKLISIFIISFYSFFTLYKTAPYYLDYYNGLVGGPRGVYEHKYFHLGWWGQGMKEAGDYISKNAPKGSRIALAISPTITFPNIFGYKFYKYSDKQKYDFVVVNFYNIIREGFDDSDIRKNYKLIYQVLVDKAPLVQIYSK